MKPLPHPRPQRRAPHPVLGPLAGAAMFMLAIVCGGTVPTASAQPAKGGSAAAPPVVAAAPATSVPTPAEIEARIKETEAATGLDEAAKTALIESLKRTSAYLDAARDFAAKASAFTDAITSAPEQTAAIRKQLSATADDDAPPTPRALAALTPDDLTGQLLKSQTEAAGIEGRLADLDKALEASGSRPAEVRGRLLEVRQATRSTDHRRGAPGRPGSAGRTGPGRRLAARRPTAGTDRGVEVARTGGGKPGRAR